MSGAPNSAFPRRLFLTAGMFSVRPGRTEYLSLEEHLALLAEQAPYVAKLEAALQFYASEDTWDLHEAMPTAWDDGVMDLGKRAREALEGKGGGEPTHQAEGGE